MSTQLPIMQMEG